MKMPLVCKIFKLVYCACRPLHVDELKEAIAIEKDDTILRTDRVPNDDGSLTIETCGSLVRFDRVSNTVELAHGSVHLWLHSQGWQRLNDNLDETVVKIEITELIITYMLFANFEAAIVRRDKDLLKIDHKLVAYAADKVNPWNTTAQWAQSVFGVSVLAQHHSDAGDSYVMPEKFFKQDRRNHLDPRESYPFLPYATEYWAEHTKCLYDVDEKAALWEKFRLLTFERQLWLQFRPWESKESLEKIYGNLPEEATKRSPHKRMFQWSVAAGHIPFIQLLRQSGRTRYLGEYFYGLDAIRLAYANGFMQLARALWDAVFYLNDDLPRLDAADVLYMTAANSQHVLKAGMEDVKMRFGGLQEYSLASAVSQAMRHRNYKAAQNILLVTSQLDALEQANLKIRPSDALKLAFKVLSGLDRRELAKLMCDQAKHSSGWQSIITVLFASVELDDASMLEEAIRCFPNQSMYCTIIEHALDWLAGNVVQRLEPHIKEPFPHCPTEALEAAIKEGVPSIVRYYLKHTLVYLWPSTAERLTQLGEAIASYTAAPATSSYGNTFSSSHYTCIGLLLQERYWSTEVAREYSFRFEAVLNITPLTQYSQKRLNHEKISESGHLHILRSIFDIYTYNMHSEEKTRLQLDFLIEGIKSLNVRLVETLLELDTDMARDPRWFDNADLRATVELGDRLHFEGLGEVLDRARDSCISRCGDGKMSEKDGRFSDPGNRIPPSRISPDWDEINSDDDSEASISKLSIKS